MFYNFQFFRWPIGRKCFEGKFLSKLPDLKLIANVYTKISREKYEKALIVRA